MKPKIHIDAVTDEFIQVFFNGEGIDVSRDPFEKWADDNDKREWSLDYTEESNIFQSSTGKMDWDEYYAHLAFPIDLEEYLTVRDAKSGKLKDIFNMPSIIIGSFKRPA